jgi:hypothetical protein
MGYMKDEHGYVGSYDGHAIHYTYPGRKLEDSVLWCFAFFLLLGFSSPVSFDDQPLIICSNSSQHIFSASIFLAIPSKFQLDKKFFLSLIIAYSP